MNIAIIGMGWFGESFARYCAKNGHQVIGTKREVISETNLPTEIEVLPFEFQNCSPDSTLKSIMDTADVLLFDIPPSAVNHDVYVNQFLKIAERVAGSNIRKSIFVSSTSVFSGSQGTVNEFTTPSPTSKNGKLLIELEQVWKNTIGDGAVVLRPGGLIGGQRHPVNYLSGREDLKGKSVPVNLVHRDDLVKMAYAISIVESSQDVFHAVAAAHPLKMEFYQKVAKNRGLTIPKFTDKDADSGKTVEATKSKYTLEITFDYENPFNM